MSFSILPQKHTVIKVVMSLAFLVGSTLSASADTPDDTAAKAMHISTEVLAIAAQLQSFGVSELPLHYRPQKMIVARGLQFISLKSERETKSPVIGLVFFKDNDQFHEAMPHLMSAFAYRTKAGRPAERACAMQRTYDIESDSRSLPVAVYACKSETGQSQTAELSILFLNGHPTFVSAFQPKHAFNEAVFQKFLIALDEKYATTDEESIKERV